jgi:hypothetical protein
MQIRVQSNCRALLIVDRVSASFPAISIWPVAGHLGVNMTSLDTNLTFGDDVKTLAATSTLVLCRSCPHAQDVHDAIALRYCAATRETTLSRGCICRGGMADGDDDPLD